MKDHAGLIWALLTACMTSAPASATDAPKLPSSSFIKREAQNFVDENNLCAVIDLSGDYRRARDWANLIPSNRSRAFDPFIRAGLLKFGPDGSGRAGYHVTDLGRQSLTQCLIDGDAYPPVIVDGFRIGRRVISAIDRLYDPPQKIDCRWYVLAKAFYKIKVEASWYKPMEFTTNLSTYGQDTNGRYYASVPFTTQSSKGPWYLDKSVGDIHAVPLCTASTLLKEE